MKIFMLPNKKERCGHLRELRNPAYLTFAQVWSSRISYLLAAVGSAVGLGSLLVTDGFNFGLTNLNSRQYMALPVPLLSQWRGVLSYSLRHRLLHARRSASGS